jgi:hypothetical protein
LIPIFAETGTAVTMAIFIAVMSSSWIAFLEIRHRKGAVTPARLAASAVAISALLLLFLRPGLMAPGPDEAWLITPGAKRVPGTARDGSSPVFSIVPGVHAGATTIPDAAWLGRNHPRLQRVIVVGHGLRWWDWSQVPGTVDWRERQALSPGLGHVAWPRDVTLGEELVVQGAITGPAASGGSIELIGPGGVEASVDTGDGEGAHFELRTVPRDAGRFLYRLVASAGDPAESIEEWLDVQVREPREITVLWLEAAPSFETRHFKHWLAAGANSLVVRSTVSRDRYRVEFHNHPDLELGQVSRSLLARFDLLVLDARTLSDLSPGEQSALRKAVREDGLGALLLSEEDAPALGRIPLWSSLAPKGIDEIEEMTVRASWPGVRGAAALTIPAREFESGPGIVPLVRDAAGRILAVSRPAGAGSIGASILRGTYRWVLEGEAATHGGYWSHLVSSLARPPREDYRWHIPPGPVILDHPLTVSLVSSHPSPDAFFIGVNRQPVRLTLRQSPMEPTHWETTLWPDEPGWNRLTVRDGPDAWFYAQPQTKWISWQQARRGEDTRRRMVGLPDPPPPAGGPAVNTFSGFSRLWFLSLFLLPLFGLWTAERR